MHIVLVEDDEVIRETTELSLQRFGYTVTGFADGREGYEFVARNGADVVLLDLMLPTMNGASICRAIRERSTVPIIVISARSDPIDIVQALEAGADDYLTKPFDMQVLNARIRSVVRRFIFSGTGTMGHSPTQPPTAVSIPEFGSDASPVAPPSQYPSPTYNSPASAESLPDLFAPTPGYTAWPPTEPPPAEPPTLAGHRTQIGSLVIDTGSLSVEVDGRDVHLTPTELRILMLLSDSPGNVFSREKIAYTVWGYEWAGDSRVVDVHIQRLRKKIGALLIETVRGFGYRLSI